MDSPRQLSLDDCVRHAAEREHANKHVSERVAQQQNLQRVTSRIGRACLDFARAHVGREYRGEHLLQWVRNATGKNVAPDSPRRVLSELERAGWVKLECRNRASSLYRIVAVHS